MSENPARQPSGLDGAVIALRQHLMEKGNCFKHGPAFEGNGQVLAGVKQAVKMYEGMGYARLVEIGDPPVYALLQRGHRELHVFQPRDPQIRQWLEDKQVNLNDPAIRAYMLQQSGLREGDIPVADKPRCYHINEVDDVFIVTSDDD